MAGYDLSTYILPPYGVRIVLTVSLHLVKAADWRLCEYISHQPLQVQVILITGIERIKLRIARFSIFPDFIGVFRRETGLWKPTFIDFKTEFFLVIFARGGLVDGEETRLGILLTHIHLKGLIRQLRTQC